MLVQDNKIKAAYAKGVFAAASGSPNINPFSVLFCDLREEEVAWALGYRNWHEMNGKPVPPEAKIHSSERENAE